MVFYTVSIGTEQKWQKKLMAHIESSLYEQIKGERRQGESEATTVLRNWHKRCKEDHEISETSVSYDALMFRSHLRNEKAFIKAVEKMGYDTDALMESIWIKTQFEALYKRLEFLSNSNKELERQLSQAEQSGVVTPRFMEEHETLKSLYAAEQAKNAELTATLQNASTGERRMSENNVTQWEYKNIRVSEDKDIEQQLNKLGENGWEATGTLSNTSAHGNIILKRPKDSYDYGYSR